MPAGSRFGWMDMKTRTALLPLLALVVLLAVPMLQPAFAYSSTVTSEGTIEVEYTMVDLVNSTTGISESVFVNREIDYSNNQKAYLKGNISDGLNLKFYGNTGEQYVLMVSITSNEDVLNEKYVRFEIDGHALEVGVNSSAVYGKQIYTPTEDGVSISLKAILPKIASDTNKEQLELGQVSFTMVKVTGTYANGDPIVNGTSGSSVITTTNTIKVNVVQINNGGDVKNILAENNASASTGDELTIRGNESTDSDKDDSGTLYKIVSEGDSKSVLIKYDDRYESLTPQGNYVNFTVNIPANVKFYLEAEIQGATSGNTNELDFQISYGAVTLEGHAQGTVATRVDKTYICSASNDSSEGITKRIVPVSNNFNGNWIYSGSEGMTLLVTGHRASQTSILGLPIVHDMELRIFMDNV